MDRIHTAEVVGSSPAARSGGGGGRHDDSVTGGCITPSERAPDLHIPGDGTSLPDYVALEPKAMAAVMGAFNLSPPKDPSKGASPNVSTPPSVQSRPSRPGQPRHHSSAARHPYRYSPVGRHGQCLRADLQGRRSGPGGRGGRSGSRHAPPESPGTSYRRPIRTRAT
jgi:hypothetical protein